MRLALALLAGAAISVGLGMFAPVSAAAGVRIKPSVEVRQVVSSDEAQDDTVTYSEAVIGFDGTVDTRRVKASFSYDYTRRFAEQGHSDRSENHSGFARADITLVDNRLTVRTGAFAALLNRDFRGYVSYSPDQNSSNLTQTYSAYVEPHYHKPIRGFADFDLSYRVGYTGTSDNSGGAGQVVGGTPGSSSSDVPLDSVGNSVNQQVQARLGNREDNTRLRWDATSTTTFEDVARLDQQYRSYDNRVEVEYVVRRGIGLIANAGYEHTSDTERPILRDVNGVPLVSPDGGFVTDATAPRRSVYAQKGFSFEGGLRLQPNRRTFLKIRAGKRFGEFTVNGDARFQITPRFILSAKLTEGVDSYGRLLTRDLDGTSVRSIVNANDVAGLGGCVFGVDPGTGTCLFDATQSITNAIFRNRAAQFIAEFRRGRTQSTLAVIYNRREFLDTNQLQAPATPVVNAGFAGGADQTVSVNANIGRSVGQRQQANVGLFYNRYQFALSAQRNDVYIGGVANYTVGMGPHVQAYANATASRRTSDAVATAFDATGSIGLRLQF